MPRPIPRSCSNSRQIFLGLGCQKCHENSISDEYLLGVIVLVDRSTESKLSKTNGGQSVSIDDLIWNLFSFARSRIYFLRLIDDESTFTNIALEVVNAGPKQPRPLVENSHT